MTAAGLALRLAVFAKAPLPGYAKTRLIPLLGAEGAARLAGTLIARTLALAEAVRPQALT
ncbi:MAG TPA: glycosyltransferase, partial [Plasticicumulans sp.]|nr:glycosyltransferase [Plasticicumulans sp.]